MLLIKILVALQISHYYGILGRPLALSKPLVKRAETPLDILRGVEEDAGRSQAFDPAGLEEKKSKSSERVLSPKTSSSFSALGQGVSEIRTVHDNQINPPSVSQVSRNQFSELSEDPNFQQDYASVIGHLDQYESEMFQRIVKNDPAANPFIHLDTLRAILDDFEKGEVLKFVQKYSTVLQSSAFEFKESHVTGYTNTYRSISTIAALHDQIPTSHPAHRMKEKICADVEILMKKFDNTAKGRVSLAMTGRLSKILIDDFTQKPPYTAQFLQDYYVNINSLLAELSNADKDSFWDFRKSYVKYSAIGSITSMTDEQVAQCRLRFEKDISQSPQDQNAYESLQDKLDYTPAAENDSGRACHKETLILLSNIGKSEMDIFFRALGNLINNFYKDKKRNFFSNLKLCGFKVWNVLNGKKYIHCL
ncbi:hypothetical protein H4Q26_005744 [Puccinia striiformis f. sp. tritici PST-130]|nr:hypothetical protein H4Q26_005744 [Puccinia striiformis f. sp. tritici PST-130]